MALNATVEAVTERVRERSADTRAAYMARFRRMRDAGPGRAHLSCGNLAHAAAGAGAGPDQDKVAHQQSPNLGIITAYNDMLSAHRPFESYPVQIREAAREVGCTAQVAAGVPAMCDGVTQGQPGMELSLFSRDVIAAAAAVGLSHNTFDAAVFLGVCDKIVPGLVIAAASFGHIPAVFMPAGPMPSGLPNDEKATIRNRFAAGEIGRDELLKAEMQSYHSPGTCTFYGTANTNQMLMEFMGLHLPGSSFVNPDTPLRDSLVRAGAQRALSITQQGNQYTPTAEILTERAFVNGIVGLHATGGSTNLALHLIAMARAAGIVLDPLDFEDLSEVTPLMTRIYPNGQADVNHFQAAGGLQFLIRDLLGEGLLHEDVRTVAGDGLGHYTQEPRLDDDRGLHWVEGTDHSHNDNILRPAATAFQSTGGLRRLTGNLGTAIIKTSAVKDEHLVVEAPVRVFHDQESVKQAFRAGELSRDVVVAVRFQGARANGMPELHSLTPPLTVLQGQGHKVMLLTDGRMSGASGKVPAAIHLSPEAARDGPIARLRDGDVVRMDATTGELNVLAADFDDRTPVQAELSESSGGLGRELFEPFRQIVGHADQGCSIFFGDYVEES